MTSLLIWTFTSEAGVGSDPTQRADITGFGVEAVDGSIGKINKATYEVGASQIVVDTGPWVLGKTVVLPAGVVQRIDVEDEKVFVNRTKDQIKDSPKFGDIDPDGPNREAIGSYYGAGGAGYRD
jgi:hypothetical protein